MTGSKDQRFPLLRTLLVTMGILQPVLLQPHSLMAEASGEAGSPVLILGGSYEHPPVGRFLPASKRTLLIPATMDRLGTVLPLGCSNGPGADLSPEAWDRFLKASRESSSLLMATLDPVMVRDNRGVIQMAVISTDSPLTASCILLPGFLQRFSAIFGPELIVAIPSRQKIYVFPKLANRIPDASQLIRDDYLISPMPVSKELFELSSKGLRAIGNVDPDDQ